MRIRPRTRLQMHSGNDLNRWTVSFADFMTLMFAVFVVLYAVSSSKEEKYKNVMFSLQNANKSFEQSLFSSAKEGILTKESNNILEEAGPALISDVAINQAEDELSDVDVLKTGKELGQLQLALKNAFLSELDDQSIRLDLNGDWLTIEMGGSLLFVGGSHSLLISAKQQIAKLAKVLKPVNNMLRIRGYTDEDPISNEIYLSNWELAGARAFAVLHELDRLGITGRRMVMEAYGQYSPVIDEKGDTNQLKSRRVVIAISKYALVEDKDSNKPEKKIQKAEQEDSSVLAPLKPDREEMHEIHLPDNRLIITTRQE